LEESRPQLVDLDWIIVTLMIAEKYSDKELEEEQMVVEDCEDKARLIKIKVETFLYPKPTRPASPNPSNASIVHGSSSGNSSQQPHFKLPKPELKKFNGNLKEWLGFWASFKKIHDISLCASDKFHYLIQSMVPGSEPSKLALTDRVSDREILIYLLVYKHVFFFTP